MKRGTLLRRLLEPKSIIFGFTIFYLIRTLALWRFGRAYHYHEDVFVAGALCTAAAGLVLNRIWSKLLAAILCAQAPLAFLFMFWTTARDTQAMPFSLRHINSWLHELADIPPGPWLWLAVSSIILAYAVPAIVRGGVRDKPTQPAG